MKCKKDITLGKVKAAFLFRPGSELDKLSKHGPNAEFRSKISSQDYIINHINDIIPATLASKEDVILLMDNNLHLPL